MMASGYSPLWKRWLHKIAPNLFKVCPDGNWHWRWDKYCACEVCDCGDFIYSLRQPVKYRVSETIWLKGGDTD